MSDPQHDLRTWLQEELAKHPHGTKGKLAAFIGVRPDAITRMANTDPKKETREIAAHELVRMREFFGEGEDVPASTKHGPSDKTDDAVLTHLWDLFDRVRRSNKDVQLQVIRLIETSLGPDQTPPRAKSRATKTKPAS